MRERKEPKVGVLLPLGRNGFPAVSLFLQASLTTTLERSMGGSFGFSGAGAVGAGVGAGAVSGTLLLPARNPGFGPAGLTTGLAGGATGRFTGKSFLGAMLLGGSPCESRGEAQPAAGTARVGEVLSKLTLFLSWVSLNSPVDTMMSAREELLHTEWECI